jgi:hypothetical protein
MGPFVVRLSAFLQERIMKMSNEIVWNSKLDDRYEVVVTRTAPYQGELTISESGKILHRQNVGLMYNAAFGPDVTDVFGWQQIAIEFIDYQQH